MKKNLDGRIALCATRLKSLRRQHGLSQELLSNYCLRKKLHISVSTIKRAETGKNISYRTARNLAKFYDIDIEQLIVNESNNSNNVLSSSTCHTLDDRFVAILVCRVNHITLTDDDIDNNLFEEFTSLVKSAAELFTGILYQNTGDSIAVVFGLPPASANQAIRSVLCAHEIFKTATKDISLAISLYHGRANRLENDLSIGGERNDRTIMQYCITPASLAKAYSLNSLTPCNEIWMTHAIKLSISTQSDCSIIRGMKGKFRDEPVWRLNTFPTEAAFEETPLIGRLLEQHNMLNYLEICAKYQQAQILLVRGLAGIGKTRLVQEFKKSVERKGYAYCTIQVVNYNYKNEKGTLITFIHQLLGLSSTSEIDPTTIKINETLAKYDLPADISTHLSALLGVKLSDDIISDYEAMSPHAKKQGRVVAVQFILERLSLESPLFICFEDIHWADSYLLEFLQSLMDGLSKIPIILLLTTRIESDPINDLWRLGVGDTSVSVIDLPPLRVEEAKQLACQYGANDREYVDRCIERAQGNPLFLNQLLQSSLKKDTLPYSIQTLIQEKIDLLKEKEQRALRVAAVIGNNFSLELLRETLEDHNYSTDELVRNHFIKQIGNEYVFVHSLVQQGIYGFIPTNLRRELHYRLSVWYSNRDMMRYARHLVLAHHPDAANALFKLAKSQYNVYRYDEIPKLIDEALEQDYAELEKFECYFLKARALRQLGQYDRALLIFEKSLHFAVTDIQRSNSLIEMAICSDLLEYTEKANSYIDQAEEIATPLNLIRELAIVHNMRGNILFPRDPSTCETEHQSSFKYAQQSDNTLLLARALSGLGDSSYALGRMNVAYQHYSECLMLCKQNNIVQVHATTLSAQASTRMYRNEILIALDEAQTSIALAAKIGHKRAEVVARLITSWILLQLDDCDRAEEQIDLALTNVERLGTMRFEVLLLESLARLRYRSGKYSDAESIVLRALYIAEKYNFMDYLGPWLLSTLAQVTQDEKESSRHMARAEALLSQGCLGHNYYQYYATAIDIALASRQWSLARKYANALQQFDLVDPNPWADFKGRRALALAQYGEGSITTKLLLEFQSLMQISASCSLQFHEAEFSEILSHHSTFLPE